MTKVVLEYKREVQQSTGCVRIVSDTESSVFYEFEKSDFEPMMYKFAEALREFPSADGIIQRTDRANLAPITLDPRTLSLFRLDPVAAVTSMNVPYVSPSNVIQNVREERTPIVSELRVGHSTLADAFGEELYARFDKKRNKIECPCCGIWARIVVSDRDGSISIECVNPSCAICRKPLDVREHNEKWASFKTEDLLATSSTRFYFPRTWNNGKIWVTRKELLAKYNEFLEEKKSCP